MLYKLYLDYTSGLRDCTDSGISMELRWMSVKEDRIRTYKTCCCQDLSKYKYYQDFCYKDSSTFVSKAVVRA